jgi:hypothetical protein
MTVNNFSFGGKILEKNLRSGESDLNEVVVCYETKEEFEKDISKGEKNAGSVTHHSIRVKDIDGVDPSDMDRIRRGVELIGSGFSSSQEELPKFGLSLAGHQISSHVLNPKFFRKHLTSQKLLSLAESTENPNCVFATAHSGNISVNLELGRLSNPLKIDKSFKVMFNEVDGLEVEDILEPGFSDDQLKNFIPKRESYFIECINRDPNDKSLFKKFLLDIMKSKGECVSMDILDQSFDGMINNKEAVSKIIRLKNEFFLKEIIKASKPALLKVNFIRKYESLDMVKKMATCIFFYSAPHVESDASKNEIGQILRSQYLRNCNVHIFGAGLQQQLPPLRNDFFTSQPIFNINLDYDGLVGYD